MCEKCLLFWFICRAYLNMPEMFTDRATDSNPTKEANYKTVSFSRLQYKTTKLVKPVIAHVIWFCHERHGMYCLCVDWCSLSCHSVIKHFVLHLIKAYIYRTTVLYFGDLSCRCSHEITWKYQPSLSDALIYVQVTNIYGRGEKDVCVYIHTYIRHFVPFQQINT
jgi:hypothetical protein